MKSLRDHIVLFVSLLLMSGCSLPFSNFVEFDNQGEINGGELRYGFIEGSISYPSEVIPDTLRICALNLTDTQEYCTDTRIQDQKYAPTGVGFRLEVPAGKYHVYSYLSNQPEYRAYFSEFVLCGMSFECGSHAPIEINVYSGITTPDVRPHDWYATTTESDVVPDPDQDVSKDQVDSQIVCWNRVVQEDDVLYWRDGCRGNPSADMMCTMALIELTESEVESYRTWVRAGSQTPNECL